MTDKELITKMRLINLHHVDAMTTILNAAELQHNAADRIEALIAEREKDHANINLKADFIDKTLNQLAETEAKLAMAVEALKFIDEDLEASEEARVLKARTTLAEIKGE